MNKMMSRAIAPAAVTLMIIGHAGTVRAAECVAAPPDLVEAGTLTIGIAAGVPPMAYIDQNKPSGFDVQMGEALAKAMCLKPKFINMPFTGLLPAINAQKLDVVSASAGITPARLQAFDMVPYFVGGIRLVALKKNNVTFKDEYDTCGHTVSTRSGSVEAHALELAKAKCPVDKPMTLSVFSSDNEAMQQLYKGVVDASFLDWPVAAYTVAIDSRVAPASPILSGDGPNTPRHIDGLMVRKGNTDLVSAIKASLKQMMDDGTYDKQLSQLNLTEGDVRKAQ
jgi:polar amino acid transport system substrate-binding protein